MGKERNEHLRLIYKRHLLKASTAFNLSHLFQQAGAQSFDGSAKAEKKEQDEKFLKAREVRVFLMFLPVFV